MIEQNHSVIAFETGHYNNRVSFIAAAQIALGDFVSKSGTSVAIDMTQGVAALDKAFDDVIGIALANYEKGERAVAVDGQYDDTLLQAESITALAPLFKAIDEKGGKTNLDALKKAVNNLGLLGYKTTQNNRYSRFMSNPYSAGVPHNVVKDNTPAKPKAKPVVALDSIKGIARDGSNHTYTKNGGKWIATADQHVEFSMTLSGTQGEKFDVVMFREGVEIGETENVSDGVQTMTPQIQGGQPLRFVAKFNGTAPMDQNYTVKVFKHNDRKKELHSDSFVVIVQGEVIMKNWITSPVNLTKGAADAELVSANDWDFNDEASNVPLSYTVKAGSIDLTPSNPSLASTNDPIKYNAANVTAAIQTGSDITVSFSDAEDAPLHAATLDKTITVGTVTATP